MSMTFPTLCFNLDWTDRYINSPGNVVWMILLLQKSWPGPYKPPLLVIGMLFAMITISTLIGNVYYACSKPSEKNIKKMMIYWVVAIVIMVIC